MSDSLTVVALPGLVPRSLGNYLATLGVLRLGQREWPSLRLAWRGEVPVLVGAPSLSTFAEKVAALALSGGLTPYGDRPWDKAQKASSKEERPEPLLNWETEQTEAVLDLYRAHIAIGDSRGNGRSNADRSFNPLLGSGGNAGKRAFDKGWRKALNALTGAGKAAGKSRTTAKSGTTGKSKTTGKDLIDPAAELERWLRGEASNLLGGYGAGSWFMEGTKRFNEGWSGESSVGVSPWAMLCACEAFPFFGGAISRRLGARTAVPAFPFVTGGPAPTSDAEQKAQTIKHELWVPLWERPMLVAEIEMLFARGRAEIAWRSAATPGLFAAAIMRRGVDSGVREFRRFVLTKTTSSNTFESRLERVVPVPVVDPPGADSHAATQDGVWSLAIERLAQFYQALPQDSDKKYRGYRGPLERALIRLATDPRNVALGLAALDATYKALARLDRNGNDRTRRASWPLLPVTFFEEVLAADVSRDEAVALRLAAALASTGWGSRHVRPLVRYRLGVEVQRRDGVAHASFVSPRPASVVMTRESLEHDLVRALRRLLLEAAAEPDGSIRRAMMTSTVPARLADVAQWLASPELDALVERWLDRCLLFDWSSARGSSGARDDQADTPRAARDPATLVAGALHAVVRVDDLARLVGRKTDESSADGDDASAGSDERRRQRQVFIASGIVARLDAGDFSGAFAQVRARFNALGLPIPEALSAQAEADPHRIVASLLMPLGERDIAALAQRWLRPKKSAPPE